VIEACLGHVGGGGGIVGVYQVHDQAEAKRAAFKIWSDHVQEIAGCA
jgi:hypothetical protein